MIRIKNLNIPLAFTSALLKEQVAYRLNLPVSAVYDCRLVKLAVDARNKHNIHYVCTLDCTLESERIINPDKNIGPAPLEENYLLPHKTSVLPPVVIGTGPAGMLAGLALAEAGLQPILLERGRDVERRKADVDMFWQSGNLDIVSNVQFGEGGAGTFSDGKLATGIKKDKYTRKVFAEFIAAGAPAEVAYLAKPHIGTDKLVAMVKNIRRKIESLGGKYLFEHRVTRLIVKNDYLTALEITKADGRRDVLPCRHAILAIGHSARDTFEMLYEQGVAMQQKPFAVGARIEHKQSLINKAQYGRKNVKDLGAADYKLAVHLPNGNSAYTFCMCPGGCVVAAASEKGRVVTNGMSEYARDGENANAALLVGVDEKDFTSKHPLAGMYFQRKLEERAFIAGGKDYKAPAQLAGDFLKNKESIRFGSVMPTYRPGVALGSIAGILPPKIAETLRVAMLEMDKKLHGFAASDAVLTAPETRSSSPVRIIRDKTLQSNIKGLYPCGEGAGYAGGITSAAADGLRVAEALVCALDN